MVCFTVYLRVTESKRLYMLWSGSYTTVAPGEQRTATTWRAVNGLSLASVPGYRSTNTSQAIYMSPGKQKWLLHLPSQQIGKYPVEEN